jgi:hypothetical protein
MHYNAILKKNNKKDQAPVNLFRDVHFACENEDTPFRACDLLLCSPMCVKPKHGQVVESIKYSKSVDVVGVYRK